MKHELWPKIRVGSHVIYADEYLGVYRAKVVEVDIEIYEPGEPSRRANPYGLTRETGVVRIQYDTTELIENLENLIAYGPSKLARLRRDWNLWQAKKANAEGLRETFLARIQEYRAY